MSNTFLIETIPEAGKYFHYQLNLNDDYLHNYTTENATGKVILVGDPRVGKTNLLQCFAEFSSLDSESKKSNINFTIKASINSIPMNCIFWKINNSNTYKTVSSDQFRCAEIALLCFSLDSRDSFENLKLWNESLDNNTINIQFKFLVGCKSDLNNQVISDQEIELQANAWNAEYFETSTKNKTSILNLFKRILFVSTIISAQQEQEIFDFLDSPQTHSFDKIHCLVWNSWKVLNKSLSMNISSIIQRICRQMIELQLPSSYDETDSFTLLKLINYKLDYFTQRISCLSNLFVFYNNFTEPELQVTKIAISIINNKFFVLDLITNQLQNQIAKIYDDLFKSKVSIPDCVDPIANFIYLTNQDLYNTLFNISLVKHYTLYINSVHRSPYPTEAILSLYDELKRIQNQLQSHLPNSTLSAFNHTFSQSVLSNCIPLLTSESILKQLFTNFDLLQKVVHLTIQGPREWFNELISKMSQQKRNDLKQINLDNFQNAVEQIAAEYQNCIDIGNLFPFLKDYIMQLFDSIFSRFVVSNDFLKGFSIFFNNMICDTVTHIDSINNFSPDCIEIPQFFIILSKFIVSNTDFMADYSRLLAQRLTSLSIDSPEKIEIQIAAEKCLLEKLINLEIQMDFPLKMLNDFRIAPRGHTEISNMKTDLIIFNKYQWSQAMKEANFKPPDKFMESFYQAIENSGVDCYKKNFVISDQYSTVEFSNGKTNFVLPLKTGLIVQQILYGNASRASIACELQMDPKTIDTQVDFLIEAGIISEKRGKLLFLKPPEGEISNNAPKIKPSIPNKPMVITNSNDQIKAACMHFLKKKKIAKFEQIKNYVFENVPSIFQVTEEKIQEILKQLQQMDLITPHDQSEDSYRYV